MTAGTSNATVSFSNQQGGTAPYTYSYDFGNTGTFEIANSSNATATIPESYVANPNTTLVVRGRIMDGAGDYTDYTIKVIIGASGWIVTPYLNIPDFGANPTIVSVQSGELVEPGDLVAGPGSYGRGRRGHRPRHHGHLRRRTPPSR